MFIGLDEQANPDRGAAGVLTSRTRRRRTVVRPQAPPSFEAPIQVIAAEVNRPNRTAPIWSEPEEDAEG